ncbi:hypothetical protein G6F65_018997 [Rhizopus arrhizus]|nr:hypothetical protein G6F65_018997 [Rhizopus arrhizus]
MPATPCGRQAHPAGQQGVAGAGRRAADPHRRTCRRRNHPDRQRTQRDLPVPALARCQHRGGRRTPDPADRLRRPVPWPQPCRAGPGHPGAGGGTPEVVDGAEDLGRFGDVDEQGPGSHRGASPVRGARRAHRGAGASAEPGAFAGRVRGRLDPGADGPAGHAHHACGRPRLAAAHRVWRGRAGSAGPGPAGFRGPGHRRVPLPGPGLAGDAGRRHRTGGAERRQRRGGFSISSGPDRFPDHPGAGC